MFRVRVISFGKPGIGEVDLCRGINFFIAFAREISPPSVPGCV
jgi:hypothetical protein